jgi:XPC-binding domain
MLEPILQQVGAGNPQLAQLIGQHPDQFLQLLSEDGDNDAPLPPGAQAISVTEEERAAIERVSHMAFKSIFILTKSSYVFLDFPETKQFKPTLPATRTKNSPPISSSTNQMMKICNESEAFPGFSFS